MALVRGECADFPLRWADRMWGPESLPNAHDQYEMRRAAVKICEACPVKAECLAFGILAGEQSGIYGGLPLRARRVVLRIAREAGLRCDPTDPTAQPRLARYIRSNPEIVVAAREHEAKRHHAELADERRRRWRESKRSAADDPSGKSGSGGE